ncbi:glycerophosphodiester phosphodiesterase family protein [Nitratifractor sp.]|uniref:glycerophosphodiester phosphodiesterase n=1 Tax=Nitratifractor sp. TaxID=2268144 RepID=UPI0025FCB5B2|nr:glycerophosphodiester phosphodiesterase family protein [Nitratifractor sp.]
MGFYDAFDKEHLIAAHRGWRAIRPENTLSAFEAAVGHCDFIELDIQLSRDGEWIVCHDESLERTTDVEERFPEGLRPRRVIDHTLAQLRRLDAGSWFVKRDPFGTLRSGEIRRREIESLPLQKLPTLREVLDFAREKQIPLNIEIKDMPILGDREVVLRFLETYETTAGLPPILISSFNHHYLYRLHRYRPSLPLAALAEGCHPPRLLPYLQELGVEAYHVAEEIANSVPLDLLRAQGIACGVYTVNDPKRQSDLYRRGFRTLFADDLFFDMLQN